MAVPTDLAVAREALRGVTVTTVTPFLSESLDIDVAGLRRNLEFLAGSDVTAIVSAGNTGEFHSLTADECERVSRITIEVIGDRQAVFAGVGGDLRTARMLAQAAQTAGAAGVLIHEPAHTFVSREGLSAYYRAICDAVDIGVAIYKRTPRLPDALLLELVDNHDNIVAVKYAWNDVAAYADLVVRMPEHVVCACGSAERWALPFSAAGTTGFTSGIANFAPQLTMQFWSALQAEPRGAETLDMWERFTRIEELRARDLGAWNVPAIKCAMDLVGLAGGPLRPPLAALEPAETASLRELVDGLGISLN